MCGMAQYAYTPEWEGTGVMEYGTVHAAYRDHSRDVWEGTEQE